MVFLDCWKSLINLSPECSQVYIFDVVSNFTISVSALGIWLAVDSFPIILKSQKEYICNLIDPHPFSFNFYSIFVLPFSNENIFVGWTKIAVIAHSKEILSMQYFKDI